jgi:hypothetical protein
MKIKKEQLQQERDAFNRKADMLGEALQAVMTDSPSIISQFTLDGCTIKLRLINPTRAHGGLVLVSQFIKGQTPDHVHDIRYVDEYFAWLQKRIGAHEYISLMYTAIATVVRERNQIVEATQYRRLDRSDSQ